MSVLKCNICDSNNSVYRVAHERGGWFDCCVKCLRIAVDKLFLGKGNNDDGLGERFFGQITVVMPRGKLNE